MTNNVEHNFFIPSGNNRKYTIVNNNNMYNACGKLQRQLRF